MEAQDIFLNNPDYTQTPIIFQEIDRIIMKHKNEKYDSSIFNLYEKPIVCIEYIYLDSDERRRFSQIGRDYLMQHFRY
jgi:hypothetical protein